MNPRNIRGNLYRGGNLMMTLFATMMSGYSSPFFLGAARLRLAASSATLPYNQAVEHGGIVKPGESGRHLCNARDAHREAVTPDKPVKVMLPTELPRQLLRRSLTAQLLRRSLTALIEIKDEGVGISPRRMGDIFLNYGASTKRRSTGDLR